MKRDLEAKGVKDPVAISAAIDRNAVDLEWSETQKHLAKKAFNVPLIFDPKKTEEQIKSIGQQIDDYFRNNDFTVKMKLDWSKTDPKNSLKRKPMARTMPKPTQTNPKKKIRRKQNDNIC